MIRELLTGALLVLLSLSTAQCGGQKGIEAPPMAFPKLGIPLRDGRPDLSQVSITMERSRCFGWCPAYTVTLSGNGDGVYTGDVYVLTEGQVPFTFDPSALAPILELLESDDFLSPHSSCETNWTDESTVTTTLSSQGRVGSIRDDGSGRDCRSNDPNAKRHTRHGEVVRLIDELAETARLIGTREEQREQMVRRAESRLKPR